MTKILSNTRHLTSFLKKQKYSKLCIVVPHNLVFHAQTIAAEVGIDDEFMITVEDGEKLKEWTVVEKLLKRFIALKLDRKSIIIAVGGGTVGDSVGFACSIYLRGIRYINIPTTLVAQVDSAHGGKTAINFAGCKNMVGTFYPSIATIVEPAFLHTLKEEQIVDGLGEIIKAGFIKDPSILKLLQKETVSTLLTSKNLKKIIQKSIAVKYYYIKKDPLDKGMRQILNVGHTIGHAIELKNKISHGRAVLMGMEREFMIGERLGVTHSSVRVHLNELLENLGITLEKNPQIDVDAIKMDKKVDGTMLILPVVTKIGKSKLIKIAKDRLL